MNQCIGSLVHLPGRGPVYLDASSASFFREPMEQVAEAAVKQRTKISLLRTVGVELQKDIFPMVGAKLNHWRTLEGVGRS